MSFKRKPQFSSLGLALSCSLLVSIDFMLRPASVCPSCSCCCEPQRKPQFSSLCVRPCFDSVPVSFKHKPQFSSVRDLPCLTRIAVNNNRKCQFFSDGVLRFLLVL